MTERHRPIRAAATPLRRAALAAALAVALAAAGASVALADATTTFDETFAPTGDSRYLWVGGIRTVDVTAVGGWGGPMDGVLGGRPDLVSGRLILPDGNRTLYVYVGGNGDGGTFGNRGGFNGGGTSVGAPEEIQVLGGGGGGASDVRLDTTPGSRLLVAAGGGGAGAHANGDVGTGGGGGGAGGDAGVAGKRAPSVTPENTWGSGGYGGGAAGATAGGLGGDAGYQYSGGGYPGQDGQDGALGAGGNGGSGPTNAPPGGGGGGGGGFYGGGGGGGGGMMSWFDGITPSTGGGGGGGGSSLVPAGGTRALVTATSGTPSVRVTYTEPGTDVTGPDGVTRDDDTDALSTLIWTNDREPAFALASTQAGSTFECRVDDGVGGVDAPWTPCSATYTAPTLVEGHHVIAFRALNADGNADSTPAVAEVIVDTVAPVTTIASGPTGTTADVRPAFAFRADEPGTTFTCRYDAAPFAPCTGGGQHRAAAALAAGRHTFAVRATDLAGNAGPIATRAFTVVVPDEGGDGNGGGGDGTGGGPKPGGGAGTGSGGSGDASTHRAPAISKLRVAKRIRKGRALPRRTRARKGATISFVLARKAGVTLSFQRALPGRRMRRGGKPACAKPTRRNRGAHRCTRYARVRGTVRLKGRKGLNHVAFHGRLTRRIALRPGRYRLTIAPRVAGGAKATARHAVFALRRPARAKMR